MICEQLYLTLAALAEVGIGPARKAHADVVVCFGMSCEQQGRRNGTWLAVDAVQTPSRPANAVSAAPSKPASSPSSDATIGTSRAADARICRRAISVAQST